MPICSQYSRISFSSRYNGPTIHSNPILFSRSTFRQLRVAFVSSFLCTTCLGQSILSFSFPHIVTMYSLIALAFYFFASILSAVHVSAKPFESPRIDNALSRRGAGILTTSGNGTGNASTALGYGTGNASMAYGYGAGNASLAYGNTSVPGLMASNISGEDNCHGSWYCGHSPIFTGGVVLTDCIAASEKFSEYEVYARFTQYAVGHCAAIFNCIPSQYYAGPTVQALFDHIYQVQPCKKCGEHYFVSRKCYAEFLPAFWVILV